jgi:alpha-amylase
MAAEMMLQAFKWDATFNGRIGDWYEFLQGKISDIADAGFTHVWLPPPSKSREQDYMGYTPVDYYDLGEFRQWVQYWDGQQKRLVWKQHDAQSSLDPSGAGTPKYTGTETVWGHKSELLALLLSLRQRGIKSIADIVINHRDPQQVNQQDEWICWGSDEHSIASGKMVWGYKGRDDDPQEISYQSGGAGIDDGEGGFSANIAHGNAKARQDIKAWLAWMKNEIGFDGWRYDYAKGFAPEHIGEYNYHTGNPFSVGEFWDTNAQLVYNWIDKTDAHDPAKRSTAFDFPLQEHLRKVFWGDKSFDQLGLWKYWYVSILGGWPEKAVTFLDNHDTVRTPYCDFPTDTKRLIQGHVFLLTHPGLPCVFHAHFYDRGSKVHDAIVALGKLRQSVGIGRNSRVDVLRATGSCYAALIDGKLVVKIGDESWNPSGLAGTWNLKLFGEGWAIWTL